MTPRRRNIHESLEFDFVQALATIADEEKFELKSAPARPFVKWAGGKRTIVPELLVRMPEQYGTYCEPFLGGAALYFTALLSGRIFRISTSRLSSPIQPCATRWTV